MKERILSFFDRWLIFFQSLCIILIGLKQFFPIPFFRWGVLGMFLFLPLGIYATIRDCKKGGFRIPTALTVIVTLWVLRLLIKTIALYRGAGVLWFF